MTDGLAAFVLETQSGQTPAGLADSDLHFLRKFYIQASPNSVVVSELSALCKGQQFLQSLSLSPSCMLSNIQVPRLHLGIQVLRTSSWQEVCAQ